MGASIAGDSTTYEHMLRRQAAFANVLHNDMFSGTSSCPTLDVCTNPSSVEAGEIHDEALEIDAGPISRGLC